jgi:CHAT domain-containing protein
LGRDDRLEQSLVLYQELFITENLRALAFRLGFSEQAQLYYSQKQQETFSRFFNVFNAYRENGNPEIIDKLLETCLHQVLFQHAYILRGNYNLLYDINRSADPQVELLATEWQVLREYLNELYIKEEPDKAGMALVKNKIIEVEKKLVRLARDSTSIRYDYIPPTDSIRKQLKEGEAGVEIIRYKENHKSYYGKKVRYAALIVKQSGPIEVVTFPEEGESMEGRHFKRYRNSIQFKMKDEHSYQVYWQPLANALQGVKKVYFAPDGIFHLINPNTLLEGASQKYVLDDVAIRMVPTIAEIHDEQPVAITTATVLGNPAYGEGQAQPQGDTLRTSREFFSRQPIAALPGTKTEVEAISKLLKQHHAKTILLTGTGASKQSLFENNRADVMHIATHGFWIDQPASPSGYYNLFETMSSSGLVLAGAQKKLDDGSFSLATQGILTSAEIQDMNLFGTRLVVLSACETGLGEVVPGEGLFGLKRALQKSGVQSLVTSLWKVDDEATMQFMTLFYNQLMETQSLSGSFDSAMRTLKENYPDPYYWGAFVLTNNR